MKLAVVYATLGRADTMAGALEFLREQTRRPDRIVISATGPADVPVLPADLDIEVVFGPKGLPIQRNSGIGAIRASGELADVVIFFDDDFAPGQTYLETIEAIFQSDPTIAGVNGRVVADGIGGPGYSFDQAREFLATFQPQELATAFSKPLAALYGCNMAIRLAHADGLKFEEALPLYAWQEDIDYTFQLARRGKLIWSGALGGVHLGIKRSRTPGVPMGYSQIANPIFLLRKRTMPPGQAYSLMARNFVANLVRSVRPEPWCDRRGRLAGNFRAFGDLMRGKLHPGRILDLI